MPWVSYLHLGDVRKKWLGSSGVHFGQLHLLVRWFTNQKGTTFAWFGKLYFASEIPLWFIGWTITKIVDIPCGAILDCLFTTHFGFEHMLTNYMLALVLCLMLFPGVFCAAISKEPFHAWERVACRGSRAKSWTRDATCFGIAEVSCTVEELANPYSPTIGIYQL